MLIVEKHFFHKITLFFTERPAKNWNIGGALRVAPVCSTPNTSLLSNLAVYNAERSELHQGSGKMLSGGPGRDSATRADGGAAGARSEWHETGVTLTRIRARPLPRAPSDHTALLHLRLSDQDQMWATQHTTVKHQRQKVSTKTIEMSVRCLWYRTIVDTFRIRNEIKSLKKTIMSNSYHYMSRVASSRDKGNR